MERIGLRAVGGSGVSISPVGLGGFEVGPQSGEDPDVDRAVAVIEAALAAGMNWLDTSENYLETRNESLIGEALERIGDDVIVASKVAPGTGVTGGGSGFRREQVRVLPISDDVRGVAAAMADEMRAAGLRATLDERSETLTYRIREGEVMKVPYMAVVGKREAEAGTVAVRARGAGKKQEVIPVAGF